MTAFDVGNWRRKEIEKKKTWNVCTKRFSENQLIGPISLVNSLFYFISRDIAVMIAHMIRWRKLWSQISREEFLYGGTWKFTNLNTWNCLMQFYHFVLMSKTIWKLMAKLTEIERVKFISNNISGRTKTNFIIVHSAEKLSIRDDRHGSTQVGINRHWRLIQKCRRWHRSVWTDSSFAEWLISKPGVLLHIRRKGL